MKEITLKEAYEILKGADALFVENREDEFPSKFQEFAFYEEEMDIENPTPCGADNGGECECYPHTFLRIGDCDNYLNFPASHNLKVKITSDGAMLLNDWDRTPAKIKILTTKNLNQ